MPAFQHSGSLCCFVMYLPAAAARCQLGRRPWAHQFKHPVLGAFTAALFQAIVAGWASAEKQLEAPPPQLTRFDLFHGHVFVAGGNRTALQDKDPRTPRRLQQQHRSLHSEQQMSTGKTVNSREEAAGTGAATQHPRVGVLVSSTTSIRIIGCNFLLKLHS